jgi:hypothetical protein
MAYDRYERERRWREGRPEFSDEGMNRERDFDRDRDDRGFFGRMGDEFRSWFGDEDSERRREYDRDRDECRRDYGGSYRPMAGDYSRTGGRQDRPRDTQWERDPYRRTSFAGPRDRSSDDDLHYHEMRRRQAEDLDRDYDEYRRERASQFESDFGNWRTKRQSKRQLLSGIRENMEVVGSDEKHVGTVDRVAGDRIILTRSDPESGGVHHSLSCSDLDRVEGDRIILDCSAEKARERWRDESRSRALFEREDQGRAGPHILDRSFSGTYR